MAKVVVYEDSIWDLENRYSALVPEHDLHAFFVDDPQFKSKTPEEFKIALEALVRAGFKGDQIHRGLPDTHPSADVYFVDGMYGKCFEILPNLPKEKTYVNTGSHPVLSQAEREGYNIVWNNSDIFEIVQRHSD